MSLKSELKFTVGYTKKVNIGNFESESFSYMETFYKGSIDPDRAFEFIKEMVMKQVVEAIRSLPKSLDTQELRAKYLDDK